MLETEQLREPDVANHPDQLAKGRYLLWLMEIERELLSAMRPKSKFDRIVLAEIAIEAGLTLIKEAETAKKMTALSRARMVRNGLMIALLAHYPIRLATREHQSVVFAAHRKCSAPSRHLPGADSGLVSNRRLKQPFPF